MPTSTAATTMRASSPAARPPIFTGMRKRAAGPRELRRLHAHGERARLAVDAEPLHADGAAGHALRAGVERTPQGRDDVSARAPVLADRNLQPRGARLHVLGHGRQQPLADHAQRDLAGGARRDRDRHAVAGRVFRLVEGDLEHVGRVGGRFGVPAGVEADRGDRAVALAGRDLQPVAAPLHRQRDTRRRAGGRIDLAVGDAPRRLHRLEVPGVVAAIPLVTRLDPQQLVAQSAARQRRAVGPDHDDIERRLLALAERAPGEQRTHADHRPGRRDRQRELALDRTAARFGKPNRHARLQRTRRLRHLLEADRERGAAAGVGRRQAFQRAAGRLRPPRRRARNGSRQNRHARKPVRRSPHLPLQDRTRARHRGSGLRP